MLRHVYQGQFVLPRMIVSVLLFRWILSIFTNVTTDYSQCLPGTASSVPASPTSTSSAAAPTSTSSTPPSGTGKLKFAGVNISGFDFGCDTTGTCTASGAWPPLTQYYGADGAGQMSHFVKDDGFNVFRLPVGWQFLTNNVLTGTLDEDNWTEYDNLVQACISSGAAGCIVDVHNYARWNGEVRDYDFCM